VRGLIRPDDIATGFGFSQAAVSQHPKVLHESGFASVGVEGARRVYAVEAGPMREVDEWLIPFRVLWTAKLDALATEVVRGKSARKK